MPDSEKPPSSDEPARASRGVRADARRSIDALIEAAKTVFATSGVDAPVREIASEAGVGIGTLYRHFPQRSDLVAEVFCSEVDACAAAASRLAAEHDPDVALEKWLYRYTDFIATKRGLAAALHSGDPAYDALPAYFREHFGPALEALLDSAVSAGAIRADVEPEDLLHAVANLCISYDEDCMSADEDESGNAQRMVAVLVDGLRYGAPAEGDDAPSTSGKASSEE